MMPIFVVALRRRRGAVRPGEKPIVVATTF